MQYGHFDDAAGEYVITRPDTPQPWCNYLGNTAFGGVITNNASGYTFYRSAALGRLSRFTFSTAPGMRPGRFVYLRDRDDGDFWSDSWMPVGKPLDQFESVCRHGTGYTKISATWRGVHSAVTYFVPLGATFEVWAVTVTNRGDAPRRLSVFPFVEPQCNWNVQDDMNNLQYTQYIAFTSLHDGVIDIANNVNMPENPDDFTDKDQQRHTFFALAGATAAGFDADLRSFLGDYGTYAAPRAVVEGKCGNATAAGDNPAAAFQVDLDLAPGESRSFAVLFGVGRAEAARALRDEYAAPERVAAALARAREHWHARLGTLRAETPDAAFNSMLNLWSPYNCLMTFYWSRAASLVYSGERDGLGFRDTAQDIVAASGLVTDESGQRLELMLTGQHANGGAMPLVLPFDHHPGHDAAPAPEEEPTYYRADDPLWLFNAVPAQVKETGDLGFYRKVLPFADHGEATVFGHLRRALDFSLARRGAHGLPCGLKADWNDCLVLGARGESVFVAFQLRYGLREYAAIADLLNEAAEAAWARERLAELDDCIEKHAWDGKWYLRAFREDGVKFGSHENAEGSIFMNAQTWAVISGHATGERARQVMAAVHERLATPCGVRLCHPPFVRDTDFNVCRARVYNGGMKENGGIFNHTQGWGVIAAATCGLRERAYEYLMNVLPASFNDRAEVRQVEPYVVCQSTHAPESPRFGAGRLSWLSGSATWNYTAMATVILGIRPDYPGLRVAPCIPAAWKGFTAKRRFRGAEFQIEVVNASGTAAAAPALTVDGKKVDGDLLPDCRSGSHVVKVEI